MIKIEMTADALKCSSPYDPGFPAGAKQLGGRWDPAEHCWLFDPRDEQRVRDLCKRIYGTDGSAGLKTLTVRIDMDKYFGRKRYGAAVYALGRQIARVFGRDSGARLGAGVVVITGALSSGGSRKSPDVTWPDGTIIEVRDVPVGALPSDTTGLTVLGNAPAGVVVEFPGRS